MLMRGLLLLILTGSVATCGQTGPLEPPPAKNTDRSGAWIAYSNFR